MHAGIYSVGGVPIEAYAAFLLPDYLRLLAFSNVSGDVPAMDFWIGVS